MGALLAWFLVVFVTALQTAYIGWTGLWCWTVSSLSME